MEALRTAQSTCAIVSCLSPPVPVLDILLYIADQRLVLLHDCMELGMGLGKSWNFRAWFVATPLILVCKLVCIDIELHIKPKGSSIEFLIILVSFDVLNAEWIVFDMQK